MNTTPQKTAARFDSFYLEAIGAAIFCVSIWFSLQYLDSVLLNYADAYKIESLIWEAHHPRTVEQYALFLTLSEKTVHQMRDYELDALVRTEQALIWSDIIGKPIPETLVQALRDFKDHEQSGNASHAAVTMGDRMERLAHMAYQLSPERTCSALYAEKRPGKVKVWEDLCYHEEGPHPQDFFFSRIYSGGTLIEGGTLQNYWSFFRLHAAWGLSLMIWFVCPQLFLSIGRGLVRSGIRTD